MSNSFHYIDIGEIFILREEETPHRLLRGCVMDISHLDINERRMPRLHLWCRQGQLDKLL